MLFKEIMMYEKHSTVYVGYIFYRQLAHDLHIPWSEYWEFLDQFIDISTSNGLDMFEYYLKKRVWLSFVKDFKEKYVLDDQALDFSAMTTPVTNRLRQVTVGDADKSFDSVFVIRIKAPVVDMKKESKEESQSGGEGDEDELKSVHDVLSPMSALSNCFSAMKLKDESWSEKATLDSSEVTDDDDRQNSNKIDNVTSSSNEDSEDKGPDIGKPNTDSEKLTGEIDIPGDNVKQSDESVKVVAGLEKTGENGKKIENVETEKSNGVVKRRLLSEGSESTASFETAAEDISDGNHTFCSQLSEPGMFHVVLNIKDSAIIVKLKDYLKASDFHQDGKGVCPTVHFVVQVKESKKDAGMTVTILSLPEIETVHKLLLLEDIKVDSCDGDISKVQGGEVIELGTGDKDQDGNQSVMAYLSRAVTLPKTKYIYG
jgi:hypothetical protein